jgi:phenylacetate-CoA ligase
MLNGLFSMDLQDNKSGFVLCRREVLEDLLRDRGRYRHWQIFIMVAARARGYSFRSVETPFDPRRAGRSSFGAWPVRASLLAIADLGRAFVHYRLGLR